MSSEENNRDTAATGSTGNKGDGNGDDVLVIDAVNRSTLSGRCNWLELGYKKSEMPTPSGEGQEMKEFDLDSSEITLPLDENIEGQEPHVHIIGNFRTDTPTSVLSSSDHDDDDGDDASSHSGDASLDVPMIFTSSLCPLDNSNNCSVDLATKLKIGQTLGQKRFKTEHEEANARQTLIEAKKREKILVQRFQDAMDLGQNECSGKIGESERTLDEHIEHGDHRRSSSKSENEGRTMCTSLSSKKSKKKKKKTISDSEQTLEEHIEDKKRRVVGSSATEEKSQTSLSTKTSKRSHSTRKSRKERAEIKGNQNGDAKSKSTKHDNPCECSEIEQEATVGSKKSKKSVKKPKKAAKKKNEPKKSKSPKRQKSNLNNGSVEGRFSDTSLDTLESADKDSQCLKSMSRRRSRSKSELSNEIPNAELEGGVGRSLSECTLERLDAADDADTLAERRKQYWSQKASKSPKASVDKGHGRRRMEMSHSRHSMQRSSSDGSLERLESPEKSRKMRGGRRGTGSNSPRTLREKSSSKNASPHSRGVLLQRKFKAQSSLGKLVSGEEDDGEEEYETTLKIGCETRKRLSPRRTRSMEGLTAPKIREKAKTGNFRLPRIEPLPKSSRRRGSSEGSLDPNSISSPRRQSSASRLIGRTDLTSTGENLRAFEQQLKSNANNIRTAKIGDFDVKSEHFRSQQSGRDFNDELGTASEHIRGHTRGSLYGSDEKAQKCTRYTHRMSGRRGTRDFDVVRQRSLSPSSSFLGGTGRAPIPFAMQRQRSLGDLNLDDKESTSLVRRLNCSLENLERSLDGLNNERQEATSLVQQLNSSLKNLDNDNTEHELPLSLAGLGTGFNHHENNESVEDGSYASPPKEGISRGDTSHRNSDRTPRRLFRIPVLSTATPAFRKKKEHHMEDQIGPTNLVTPSSLQPKRRSLNDFLNRQHDQETKRDGGHVELGNEGDHGSVLGTRSLFGRRPSTANAFGGGRDTNNLSRSNHSRRTMQGFGAAVKDLLSGSQHGRKDSSVLAMAKKGVYSDESEEFASLIRDGDMPSNGVLVDDDDLDHPKSMICDREPSMDFEDAIAPFSSSIGRLRIPLSRSGSDRSLTSKGKGRRSMTNICERKHNSFNGLENEGPAIKLAGLDRSHRLSRTNNFSFDTMSNKSRLTGQDGKSTEQRRTEIRNALMSCLDDELDKDFLEFLKKAPMAPKK